MSSAIEAEKLRAEGEESRIETSLSELISAEEARAISAETALSGYVNDKYDFLADKISDNTTKIKKISELKELPGGFYDDSGNGILDVLHREFHNFTGSTVAGGEGTEVSNPNEVAIGQYNVSNTETDAEGNYVASGCTAFSIGNGTDNENRKNIFEIRKDGSVYIWVEGEFVSLNTLVEGLTHETY